MVSKRQKEFPSFCVLKVRSKLFPLNSEIVTRVLYFYLPLVHAVFRVRGYGLQYDILFVSVIVNRLIIYGV